MTKKIAEIAEEKKARSQGQDSKEDQLRDVRSAFYSQHPDTEDTTYWIVETFDDHVIVEAGNGSFFLVNYTTDGDDYLFAEKVEVIPVSTEWTVETTDIPDDATDDIKSLTVKNLGGNRLGGYAVVWGDEKAVDLDGEWFDADTEELDSIFKSVGRLPYLYDHAMDNTLKTSVVGVVDVMAADDVGLWYEVQLDRANQYATAIQQLASASKIGTSSGTLSGARRVEKSGRIARWPIVELSGTPWPADPRQRTEHPVAEMKSMFKSIGLELDIQADDDESAKTGPEAGRKPAATVAGESGDAQRLLIELDILEMSL